ncbi:serine/threonine-protein kinase [Planctomyces sp. SH-PL62]|uniref:serine/threonine-protein kinase n=1 Tax=Planctomyces sp. SH-PL62 TaxID=1636152 RepID=UPI00078B3702|nr:serine/threonine-protein kinase [Planctomyces sp. SH-PL62]AMV36503.1 Serine/threonine-protein kinase PrkC [Planctomyces sp. SH-PL62]
MSQGFLGEQLGSFRLEEVLGSGAMGIVFKATQETTGRPAAVKIVQGEVADNAKLLQRFSREAEIIKQFRHPNIVRWLATGKFRGTYYFAMEYVEGSTLDKVLQERGEIPWLEVVDLAIQICDALQYAHQQGVVHRDLKPSNLMVTPDGRIKLTDFGIAKDLDRTALTAPGRTLGTAAYMAPEQIRGTPAVSHKTDLYALGALLYQMLVGKPPFSGSSAVVLMHCHINEPPPRPSAKVQEIPKALDDVVVALMAKNPTERPWDADAVSVILRELREKAEKKQTVAMVWPEAGSSAANPTRAGIGVEAAPPKGAAKSKKKKKGRSSGVSSAANLDGDERSFFTRDRMEVGGLVLGLVAIAALVAYWLWPPGAEYLYRHAVPLMESTRRSDWLTARAEYIDPLDKRFPDHPYREETQAWRDKIALDEAEGRAKLLASPTPTPFSQPQTNGERQFAAFHSLASKAEAEGDELTAQRYWREMIGTIAADDPDERKWLLLAHHRADDLATRIRERRAFVEQQYLRAVAALQAGRPREASAIQGMLREKYGRYTDLAEFFAPVPTPSPEPPPQPTDASDGEKSPAEPE